MKIKPKADNRAQVFNDRIYNRRYVDIFADGHDGTIKLEVKEMKKHELGEPCPTDTDKILAIIVIPKKDHGAILLESMEE